MDYVIYNYIDIINLLFIKGNIFEFVSESN